MACIKTYSELRILSEVHPPDVISRMLKTEATEVLLRDPEALDEQTRLRHTWLWSTKGRLDSTNPLEHVSAVVDAVEYRGMALSVLRKTCSIEIYCYYLTNSRGGPKLTAEIIRKLGYLSIDISWDIDFHAGC
ncbi:hypothetical protein HCH_04121 [Hahella chejuensis KCTC 2396]|uniref:DUF4279 domain-containing protein n=2 Tax=Hahella chejuensis TaxID=158327 RepID=Q2SEU3_HAHCH|nr:hypothetical protein HCH_04121 [Hahella chejuensis KCTC 2396]